MPPPATTHLDPYGLGILKITFCLQLQVRLPAGLDIGTADNNQQTVLEEDQNDEGGEGGGQV